MNLTLPQNKIPEWAVRIRRLVAKLGDNQQSFARRLGVSPATLSRWVNGKNEPTPDMYVALGNLLGTPQGCYFWERAGVECYNPPAESGRREPGSRAVNVRDYEVSAHRRGSGLLASDEKLVAIPLLGVTAFADENAPAESVSLSEANIEAVLTAPVDWCPHPEGMIGMRVSGDSMLPLIPASAILIIDTMRNRREQLDRRIVVVGHRDHGFKVARMQRIAQSYLLISANHRCMPVDISNALQWKVLGEVLWWIAHDDTAESPPAPAKSGTAAGSE